MGEQPVPAACPLHVGVGCRALAGGWGEEGAAGNSMNVAFHGRPAGEPKPSIFKWHSSF